MNGFDFASRHRVCRRGWRLALAACAALTLAGAGEPARANLMIDATFDSSITSDPNAAAIEASLNAAGAALENDIATNTTANIYFEEIGSGLGQSQTSFYTESYYAYYNQLAAIDGAPGASVAQKTALASLGPAPGSATSPNPVNGSLDVGVTSANLRALGDLSATPNVSVGASKYDSIIYLNTSITSPPNALNGSIYGLQSVATHEIDEALGIGGSGSLLGGTYAGNPIGVLDLYRYSAAGVRGFSTSASSAYFSINGGTTVLSYFNQSSGADYGDWLSNPIPGGFGPQVQDAFGEPGTNPALGINELTALNVIGYDLVTTPEPVSLAIMLPGVIGLIGLRRRARRAGPRTVVRPS